MKDIAKVMETLQELIDYARNNELNITLIASEELNNFVVTRRNN